MAQTIIIETFFFFFVGYRFKDSLIGFHFRLFSARQCRMQVVEQVSSTVFYHRIIGAVAISGELIYHAHSTELSTL